MHSKSRIFSVRRSGTPPNDSSATASRPGPSTQGGGDSKAGGIEDAVRFLGIAASKVGIYGSGHPASQGAVGDAFSACQTLLADHKAVEFSLDRHNLVVNGEVADQVNGQLLAQFIERQRMSGFVIKAPLKPDDFATFVALLGTAPQQLEPDGGLTGAMSKAGLLSIRSVETQYQRSGSANEGKERENPASTSSPSPPPRSSHGHPRSPAEKTANVLDLSLEMTLEDATRALFEDAGSAPPEPGPAPSPSVPSTFEGPASTRRLESLVRQLRLLTQAIGSRGIAGPGAGTILIRQLRQEVSDAAEGARSHIDSIATDLLADARIVDDLEMGARSRGIVLRNSRSELLAKLAEVVQELYQPLTVASGVVDMMLGGNLDAITPNQSEMLKLASESMALVGHLATHLKELVGDPEKLNPDETILKSAYRNAPS